MEVLTTRSKNETNIRPRQPEHTRLLGFCFKRAPLKEKTNDLCFNVVR